MCISELILLIASVLIRTLLLSNSSNVPALLNESGKNNSGSKSILIGFNAGYSNSGEESVLIGGRAGYSNQGKKNVFVGGYSGSVNTLGAYNSFIGYAAGKLNSITKLEKKFSFSEFEKGIYTIAVSYENGETQTQKVVIQ